MTKTILPKKTRFENPIATDDEAQQQLVADPSIPQFENTNVSYIPSNATTTFGSTTPTGFIDNENSFTNTNANKNYPVQYNQQPVTTNAGDNAGQNADILVKHSKESSDWINKKWRPAMGWMYMVVCIFDFILFPIMFTIVQFWETQAANDAFRQWQPLTLSGAGLFHMAMGAVLGIAAYGRTKEKLEGATKN